MGISRIDCCQFLSASQTNCTMTHFADHGKDFSHDAINRLLRRNKLTRQIIWDHIKGDVVQSPNGCLSLSGCLLKLGHYRQKGKKIHGFFLRKKRCFHLQEIMGQDKKTGVSRFFFSDYWKSYAELMISEEQHMQIKIRDLYGRRVCAKPNATPSINICLKYLQNCCFLSSIAC